MRILYAETTAHYPSSAHFLEALRDMATRGECEYHFLDESNYISARRWLAERAACRLMRRPPRGQRDLNRALLHEAVSFRPDVILIGKGACFAPGTLRAVRAATGASLINWATDDPFNRAAGTRSLRDSIPLYDLYVCTKRAVMADIERAGCRRVAYVRFAYKPQVHFPEAPSTADERARFGCDVGFVGGCDRDRGPYFEALVAALPHLRINFFGRYYDRFPRLKPYWRSMANGRDFRLAVSGARISLNLVRRANRDDHVMRTFEVPACGGFMLAERTPAHEQLFAEDREAAFFSSPDEMVAKVNEWLKRDEDRIRVAAAGRRRIVEGGNTYSDRLDELLAVAGINRELG